MNTFNPANCTIKLVQIQGQNNYRTYSEKLTENRCPRVAEVLATSLKTAVFSGPSTFLKGQALHIVIEGKMVHSLILTSDLVTVLYWRYSSSRIATVYTRLTATPRTSTNQSNLVRWRLIVLSFLCHFFFLICALKRTYQSA